MNDALVILFERLEKEGDVALSEIYTLTSPHLFGIISNIVRDKTAAKTTLKSVYRQIWIERSDLSRTRTAPLTYLRRLAHRFAMDHMAKSGAKNFIETSSINFDNLDFPKLKSIGLTSQDLRILQCAYLQGVPTSEIAKREGLNEKAVRKSLDETLNRIIGGTS